jgi:antitoxin HigA-1
LGKRGITADTALRLSKALGTSAEFWMSLQASFDLEETEREIAPALRGMELLAA